MRKQCLAAALAVLCVTAGCDRTQPAEADGRLMILPSGLDFQRVAMFKNNELPLKARNVGRGRISIEAMSVDDPTGSYSARLASDPKRDMVTGETADMAVSFHPVSPGPFTAVLSVTTDSQRADERYTEITLQGVGVDARATLSDTTLNFGRIEVAAKKSLPLTLTNISDLPIQVTLAPQGTNAAEFSTDSVVTLDGNEVKTVQVTFAPTQVGRKNASLQVVPCEGCAPMQVTLIGEGLDRAVVAEPPVIDFGPVPIDRSHDEVATLHNISTEPVTLTGFQLTATTDASFTADPAVFPMVLQPDQRVKFTLHYAPGHMGDATGEVDYQVDSIRNPVTSVQLTGFGGAAELCVSPWSYDFGTLPVGGKASTLITLRNCGSDGAPLTVTDATFGGDGVPGEDQFSISGATLPHVLQPGQVMTIKVSYEPTRDGLAGGFLHLSSTGFGAARLKVGVNGNALTYPDCALTYTPAALDFGTVIPGYGDVLGIKVSNQSPQLCAVKNIQLTDDADGRYTMPGAAIDGVVLYPGDWFVFQVAFFAKEPSSGTYPGALQIESSDVTKPRTLVPLTAKVGPSCIVANPRFLDFGVARPDCPPAPGEVNFQNACAAPVEVTNLALGPGTTDAEFKLDGTTVALPVTLQPGQSFTATVSYLAQVQGMNVSPLFLYTDDLVKPLLVPVIGESSPIETQTDSFVQQDATKTDVLFVVDNTASMVEEHPRLVNAIPAFVSAASSRGIDLHVAVTTTGIDAANPACPGGASGGEAGRLFPANNSAPRELTSAMPNLTPALQDNVQVGECAYVEQGLEAMRRALSTPLVDHADDPVTTLPDDGNLGFLRKEAGLAVVFVGDEDDHSPDSVATYVKFLQTVKGVDQPQRAMIFGIVPDGSSCSTAGGSGTRYAQAAQMTGGKVMSVCATDYSPLLTDVADQAFTPQAVFPLSKKPDMNTITVQVDGADVDNWVYDAPSNSVIFQQAPSPGSEISITYKKLCS